MEYSKEDLMEAKKQRRSHLVENDPINPSSWKLKRNLRARNHRVHLCYSFYVVVMNQKVIKPTLVSDFTLTSAVA